MTLSAVTLIVLAALTVALLAVAGAAAFVRWTIRAYARKEELMYAKIGDLLDRNMHLTDGGAFTGARLPYRDRVADDEPLTLRHMGIVEDPYEAPEDFPAYSGHPQPTAEELI